MLEGELMFYKGDFAASETAYMKAALYMPDNETVIDRLANVSVARDKYEQLPNIWSSCSKWIRVTRQPNRGWLLSDSK
jgi:hypothetical protein